MASKSVSIEELLVSSLATNNALAKLLIEKAIITQQKFFAEDRSGAGNISGDAKTHATLTHNS